jgi:hypothetical protein
MSESYHSGTGKGSVYSREYSGGGSYRFTGEQWSAGSGVGYGGGGGCTCPGGQLGVGGGLGEFGGGGRGGGGNGPQGFA